MNPDEMATGAGVGAHCREVFSGAGINRGQGITVGMAEVKVTEGRGRKVVAANGPDCEHAPKRRVCEGGKRSGGAMIEVEQSAQSLGFANRPGLSLCTFVGEGDDIVEPLMIAFVLVVGQKLLERVAQGTPAKENQLLETLLFDGAHPPFSEGVEAG